MSLKLLQLPGGEPHLIWAVLGDWSVLSYPPLYVLIMESAGLALEGLPFLIPYDGYYMPRCYVAYSVLARYFHAFAAQ